MVDAGLVNWLSRHYIEDPAPRRYQVPNLANVRGCVCHETWTRAAQSNSILLSGGLSPLTAISKTFCQVLILIRGAPITFGTRNQRHRCIVLLKRRLSNCQLSLLCNRALAELIVCPLRLVALKLTINSVSTNKTNSCTHSDDYPINRSFLGASQPFIGRCASQRCACGWSSARTADKFLIHSDDHGSFLILSADHVVAIARGPPGVVPRQKSGKKNCNSHHSIVPNSRLFYEHATMRRPHMGKNLK